MAPDIATGPISGNRMTDHQQDSQASRHAETPVGDGNYVVKLGECIASIAYEHGHFWQTILNHPANRELKDARRNYHVLLPGDRLTVPPICLKEESAVTDKRHFYRLKGSSEVFQLRLLDVDEQPRANLQYILVIGQRTFTGTTDDQGQLRHSIPPNARRGRLILGSGQDTEEIELRLGDLNPTHAISGAQARLTNLGFDCGPIDGIFGPLTRNAIKRFQKAAGLPPTGELDAPTMQELEAKYGS